MLCMVVMIEADDGAELWVERTGGGPGVPLVLCHGGPGTWDNLGPLAALLDQERPVVGWDQRGCGRSGGSGGPFTLKQFLADLDAIRQQLGISRWIVGGHSWGASLALRAVLDDPCSAAGLLYLSGTGLGRSWHAAYTAAPGERLTPQQLARGEELEALAHRPPRRPNGELCAVLLAACTSLGLPALFLHGAEDPRPPYAIDDLAAAIPEATVHVVAGVGHTPWLERPGAVAAILRPWLKAVA